VALVMILVVVAVAANGYRLAGYLAALSVAGWFDFFLTQPYETFSITGGPTSRRPCCCW
jgi:K+-sensing histidine kinase KdpD